MPLDNQTLLFSLMLISGLMALSLAVVARDDEQDGLRKWSGAVMLEAVAWMLIALRGAIPDTLSILVANLLMASAQAMKLGAIHEYRKQDWPRWQCILPVLLAVMLFTLLPYDAVRARIAWGSLLYGLQAALILQALYTDVDSRTGRAWGLIFYSYAVMLPMLLIRGAVTAFGAFHLALPNMSVAPNPMQLAVFVCLVALNLLGSMGFILMIKERADREMHTLAMSDPLTKIFNRRALMAQAEKEIASAERNRLPLALVMIDIDHFKRINDQYGHTAGDAVLVEVASLLALHLRRQDTIGRYGGEEFCILLPATDADGAAALAEKLRAGVASAMLPTERADIPVTISLGVTVWQADMNPSDCGRLLEEADQALYQAKTKGRNRAVVFPASSPHAAPLDASLRYQV